MSACGVGAAYPVKVTFLMTQCEEFFFGEGARMPEDWVPEDRAPPTPRKK
jgi:hypothetical protein